MATEDLINELKFMVNIPSDFRLEIYDDEENEDVIAKNISQEILDYLSAKLKAIGGNVKIVCSSDIIRSFKDSCEMNSDLFISSRVMFKTKKEYSWAAIQFFAEKTSTSLGIASCLANNLSKITDGSNEKNLLFEKALFKEETCDLKRDESIPSVILALCLGHNAMSVYNTDKDYFLEQLVDSMLYSITDYLCPESLYDIDLKEYVD